MGYRIAIDMTDAAGAEARLWALVSRRHVDVSAAWFRKHRADHRIEATLDVELDLPDVHRLIRQLRRHYDIRRIALDGDPTKRPPAPSRVPARRLRIAAKKGARV